MRGLPAPFAQSIVSQHEGRTGSQHGIDQQQSLALQLATRDVFDLDGKLTVLGTLAISRNESVLRIVEVVQESLMKGKSRPEDRSDHDLVGDHRYRSLAQRSFDHLHRILERFRYFIGHDLSDTLQITAETHRILLDRLVADFGDKLVENGVLTVENVQHKVVFI